MSLKQFLQSFPKHLIVTPKEGSRDGWNDVKRDLPEEQVVGRAVYFTPNGFDVDKRGEEDVVQFNSVYIDVDADKESTPDEVETYVKKKTGEVFGLIEPTYIVRTKNGAHFHFLLETPVEVTEESRRNYIHVMDSMVDHFNADTGAKGINRVLRVPGFKHYKDINDPFDVNVSYESPDTRYTLEQIAEAVGIEYPAPVKESVEAVYGSLEGDSGAALEKMLAKPHIKELWDGEVPQDQLSESDMSLCSHLAFWLQKDPTAMETAWLSSPLGAREKTQKREDYRKRTIDNAIAGTSDVYTPKKASLGTVAEGCPERDAYISHLADEWEDGEKWEKRRKVLEASYVVNFYKYFAERYPHLKFESGEDKSYFDYNEAEGIYEGVNFSTVRGMVINLLIEEQMSSKATEATAKIVLNKYRGQLKDRGVTLNSFTTPEGMIAMNNGWFNLKTETLTPHCPERLCLFKSSLDYDANATCPLWNKFLDEDLQMPEDQVRVIDQFSGYLLTPDISKHTSLFFDGRSGAGKSTIPNIWTKILGNLSTKASLSSLDGGEVRFMGDEFAHKHLCFFDEANPRAKSINEYFQNLITGESVRVERKGIQEKPDVSNTLKVVVALNEMPDHMPPGMKRRYRHIAFKRSFTEEGVDDPDFAKRIIESELPGVFNRMVRGLKDLEKMGHFTVIGGEDERRREYDLTSDDFSAFLADNFDPTGSDKAVRYDGLQMLESFQTEYPKGYNRQLTVRGFNKKLLATRLPEFKDIQFTMGSGKRGYQGLKLKPNRQFYRKTDQYGNDKVYTIIDSFEGEF